MKTLIIGCGLMGLTTAYLLRLRGHEVTVLDRNSGPGQETSFANGALLTPSMSDPWNAPGSWRVLLSSLLRSDAPLQLHLRTLPSMMGWGIEFLKNSRPGAYDRNTRRNLSLALYSLDVLKALREQTNIDYGRTARGSLRIFRDRDGFERACAAAERLRSEGLGYRALSAVEATEFEPALAPIASELVGAVHYQTDETGDAYQFCVRLAECA
ncbi:MAG TPA: FAD-dependent oxidoreductase, partial [Steroidobacteraceae bacterium]